MSPQVADIFNDKASKNTAFNITLKDVQATDAYDFNKLYSSILRFCGDNFGWCSYLPIDCIEPYDENITTGLYYVETNVFFPCRGNGWYADMFVCEALNLSLITHDDIKYQIKSSHTLNPRFFEYFVDAIVKSFANYKQANNGFIGILAKSYNTYEKHYFTQDRMTALKEWLKKPDEVSYAGIYDNSKDLHAYQFLMQLNPRAELVRVKTDLLGYINIDNEIKTDDYTWGEVKREWLPPKPTQICDVAKLTRTNKFEHQPKEWRTHKREILDSDDVKSILKYGGLINGGAGAGKSTTLRKIKDALAENTFIVGAFTHKASNIVDGTTLHRLLGIDVKTKKIDYKLIKSYMKAGITHFFVDEVSMIPSWIWNILAHIKREYGFIFIGCGDWKQLAPVEEEHIDFENSWIVKYVFSRNLYQLTKVWRFNENELLQDAYAASNGDAIDFTKYNNQEHELALCHSNDAVDAINRRWNEHYAKQHKRTKEVNGFDHTKFIMYPGLKLMAYKTHNAYKFTNSQELEILSWTDSTIQLKTANNEVLEIEMERTTSFKPRYAMTCHKSQGSTFTENYSIYEYESMKPRMLYVALTRARNKQQINFCKIDNYKPHTGHIYSYEYGGKYYIGSTKDLTKRKQEHRDGKKAGDTKFQKAIRIHGFDSFKYRVVETIKYSNIRELWQLEDEYIAKYNSIDNGYNIRYNREKTL